MNREDQCDIWMYGPLVPHISESVPCRQYTTSVFRHYILLVCNMEKQTSQHHKKTSSVAEGGGTSGMAKWCWNSLAGSHVSSQIFPLENIIIERNNTKNINIMLGITSCFLCLTPEVEHDKDISLSTVLKCKLSFLWIFSTSATLFVI